MRFDLPLTAFALESAGAAARALGVCHTLTLPEAQHEPGVSSPLLALADETADAFTGLAIAIRCDAPAALTITF